MLRKLPLLLAALLIAAFAALMLTKTLPYYSFEKGIHFLTTKSDETNDNPWFRLGFYVHITTSLGVLVLGLLQWLPLVARRGPRLHRWLGYGYVGGILGLAAPSGLILARFANGGLVAQVGFTLQCVVWWLTTWLAYRAARRRQWPRHVEWQMRSYAVTLAALALRSESYLMYYAFHTKPIETYLTVTWLSWVGNLLVAEVLLEIGLARYFLRAIIRQLRPNLGA
jgi:signal transduction histidine kinase